MKTINQFNGNLNNSMEKQKHEKVVRNKKKKTEN